MADHRDVRTRNGGAIVWYTLGASSAPPVESDRRHRRCRRLGSQLDDRTDRGHRVAMFVEPSAGAPGEPFY